MDKPTKQRRAVCFACVMSALAGCLPIAGKSAPSGTGAIDPRFRGIRGIRFSMDATVPLYGVTMTDEDGSYVARAAELSPKNGGNSLFPDAGSLPKTLRITWHSHPVTSSNDKWIGGTPVADITVPVSERIPDQVLDAVRRGEGGLRLKIRLRPGAVMIGWDIERVITHEEALRKKLPNSGVFHSMAGGDFCEAKIDNGKVVRPGWYIDSNTGRRIETNH